MQISALQSLSVSGQQVSAANNGMAQFKKNFDAIGDALESGDLSAPKEPTSNFKRTRRRRATATIRWAR